MRNTLGAVFLFGLIFSLFIPNTPAYADTAVEIAARLYKKDRFVEPNLLHRKFRASTKSKAIVLACAAFVSRLAARKDLQSYTELTVDVKIVHPRKNVSTDWSGAWTHKYRYFPPYNKAFLRIQCMKWWD